MANTQRDAAKERYWRGVVQRHAASGLGVRAFCRQQGLAESAFYAWRRTIQQRDAAARSESKATLPNDAQAFVPVVVTGAPREPNIVMELAGGRVLRVQPPVSPGWLAELLHALEAQGTP
jgi:transposase